MQVAQGGVGVAGGPGCASLDQGESRLAVGVVPSLDEGAGAGEVDLPDRLSTGPHGAVGPRQQHPRLGDGVAVELAVAAGQHEVLHVTLEGQRAPAPQHRLEGRQGPGGQVDVHRLLVFVGTAGHRQQPGSVHRQAGEDFGTVLPEGVGKPQLGTEHDALGGAAAQLLQGLGLGELQHPCPHVALDPPPAAVGSVGARGGDQQAAAP